jgi:predicted amidohydrolase
VRDPAGRDEYVRYHNSAVVVDRGSPAIQRLEAVAKSFDLFLVIGVIEKDPNGGSLYCTAIFVDPARGLVAKHRKLQPTGAERLIWAQGDATTLPVVEHTFASSGSGGEVEGSKENPAAVEGVSARMSACICWESYMVITNPNSTTLR